MPPGTLSGRDRFSLAHTDAGGNAKVRSPFTGQYDPIFAVPVRSAVVGSSIGAHQRVRSFWIFHFLDHLFGAICQGASPANVIVKGLLAAAGVP